MRIVGGKNRGKSILTPKNLPVRPTTDFAKESLFNILSNTINFEELNLLELFAGTGNIGYEFNSRGCQNITSIDADFKCVQFIKKMSKELNFQNRVIRTDAFKFINKTKEKFNFIFADPPYDHIYLIKLPSMIFSKDILTKDGLLVIEHDKSIDFTKEKYFEKVKVYGKVNFSFFNFEA